MYSKAKSELQTLLNKHPASAQATKAKQLIDIVDTGIAEQKLAEEKAKAEKERHANATKKMLFEQRMNISEISDAIGYKNPRHFSAAFKRKFGITPSQLRK